MPHLPPSLLTHLDTDVQILERLVQRSKDQHESSIFFQSAKHVLRVGRKVVMLLEKAKSDAAEGSKESEKREKKLQQLVKIFATTLLKSSSKNSQQIKLLYFLPLTTLFQAIYGRLFTLTLSLGSAVGLDVETLCGLEAPFGSSRLVGVSAEAAATKATAEDFGQKIERGAVPLRITEVKATPSISRSVSPAIESESVMSDGGARAGKKSKKKPAAETGAMGAERRGDLEEISKAASPAVKRPSPAPQVAIEPSVGKTRIGRQVRGSPAIQAAQATIKHAVSEDLDAIFGETTTKKAPKTKDRPRDAVAEVPRKKKKKKVGDDMDAIFG